MRWLNKIFPQEIYHCICLRLLWWIVIYCTLTGASQVLLCSRRGSMVFNMEYCQKCFLLWQENNTRKIKEHTPTHTPCGQSIFAVWLEQASKVGDSSLGVGSLMLDNNILVWLQIFNTFLDSAAQKWLLE